MTRSRTVLVLLTAVYLALLLTLGFWMDRGLRSVSVVALSNSVRVIGREIVAAIEAGGDTVLPLDPEQRERVKAILSDLTERSEVVQALDVVSIDGWVLASDSPELVGQRVAAADEVLKSDATMRLVEPLRALTPAAIYELYLPLRKSGELEGYLRMAIASEALSAIYVHQRTQMLAVAILGLAGMVLVSILVQDQFSRRGAATARAVEEILTGRVTLPKVQLRDATFSRVFEEAGRLAERLRAEGGAVSAKMADQVERLTRLHTALAHELKAPLHAIVLNLDLLERVVARAADGSHESGERYVRVIKEEIGRLERSVVALGGTERRQAAWEPVDLRGVVTSVADLLRPRAQAQHIEMALDCDGGPAYVDGYRDSLKQAILNLAQNAIEAMPEGGNLRLAVTESGEGWCVAVEDNGVGFAPEVLERLGSRPATTKATGTGVGLYLAQAVVGAHGGRVDLRSREGEGTCCELYLPRAREAP